MTISKLTIQTMGGNCSYIKNTKEKCLELAELYKEDPNILWIGIRDYPMNNTTSRVELFFRGFDE